MSTWQISYIPMPARHKRTLLLLAGLTVLAAALSLAAGPVVLSPGELWAALIGRSCGTAGTILLHIRLPRTCACLLAGAPWPPRELSFKVCWQTPWPLPTSSG